MRLAKSVRSHFAPFSSLISLPTVPLLDNTSTMASPESATLPPVNELKTLSTESRANVLDLLFEPSQQLHTLTVELLKTQAFESYDDLIASVGVQLTELAESSSKSDTEWLEAILGSHPRLGAKKVESAQSQAEQANLQKGSATEAEQLQKLNEEYETTYPGLKYVVFVNGRDRPTIMEDMRRRIALKDISGERHAAIKAMCEIAADRARKLLG
ncbi:OHCU decarboxylase-domain-containing protein [Elsinoe ampelina]|uniref:OHCU decarboxylase-domain-containing protein n=1 Tax=Elsinoe ampelina TaxID=302913 RepID=A0A6A6GIW7_9PEZI|nr:OHCU decarboxylase-domain-containing protein [Elsinoe ampelina]